MTNVEISDTKTYYNVQSLKSVILESFWIIYLLSWYKVINAFINWASIWKQLPTAACFKAIAIENELVITRYTFPVLEGIISCSNQVNFSLLNTWLLNTWLHHMCSIHVIPQHVTTGQMFNTRDCKCGYWISIIFHFWIFKKIRERNIKVIAEVVVTQIILTKS